MLELLICPFQRAYKKFRGIGFGYDANGRMVKATKANVPDALSVYDRQAVRPVPAPK